jgi:formamidopyrimidine-DNA glycosylase
MPELPEVERFRQLLLPLVSCHNNNNRTDDDDDSADNAAAVHIRVLAPHRGISIHSDNGDDDDGHDDGDTKNVVAVAERSTGGEVQEVVRSFPGGCAAVHRKGKQLCLEFRPHHRRQQNEAPTSSSSCCLCLHMGMTGSIRVRGVGENWGHSGDIKDLASSSSSTTSDHDEQQRVDDNDCWPPKFAYLSIIRHGRHSRSGSGNNDGTAASSSSSSSDYEVYFCDARKFGKAFFVDQPADVLDALAPDAQLLPPPLPLQRLRKTKSDDSMVKEDDDDDAADQDAAVQDDDQDDADQDNDETIMMIVPRLAQQRMGVKALLLDQKRVVSGVGNWYVRVCLLCVCCCCCCFYLRRRIQNMFSVGFVVVLTLPCCLFRRRRVSFRFRLFWLCCFLTVIIRQHICMYIYLLTGSPTRSCTKPVCIRNNPT